MKFAETRSPILDLPDLLPGDYDFFSRLIYERSGIILREGKQTMVATRLAKRLRQLGINSYSEYRTCLETGDEKELQRFVNLLTTNKTHFFRESSQFDFVLEHFLPSYRSGNSTLFAWSAACSTGPEAYTLAMVLDQGIKNHSSFRDYKVLATDIDTDVLEVASRGIYDRSLVEHDVPELYFRKYFLQGTAKNAGFCRLDSELTAHIKFRQHNLLATTAPPLMFDLILIRNVLIYFESSDINRLIANVIQRLNPGGLLVVGQCEPLQKLPPGLSQVEVSIYRRAP